jgi:di/tricarboxylate transporter
MPDLPNIHALIVLGLTVFTLFLFTRDRIPLETSSLLILIMLVLIFQLFPFQHDGVELDPTEFFAGFGHEALITIVALMIVGKGLETTGALQPVAVKMAMAWVRRPRLALLVTLAVSALLSAFLNNTPIVVMLMPMLVGVAIRTGVPVSRMLMPMGLATLLGGMGTTIGTSTNLLVVSIAADMGQRPIGLFDFSLPVLMVGSVGLLYLWLVAPRILPERKPPMADTSPRVFDAYLHVLENSYANGKTVAEVRARTHNRIRIERIQRGEGLFLAKLPSVKLQEGDRLLVRDTRERLKEFEEALGVALHNVSDRDEAGDQADGTLPGEADAQQIAEVVVTRGSMLHQRTLKEVRFGSRYKLTPLAVHRARSTYGERPEDLSDSPLRAGDVILVQGFMEHIKDLKNSGQMLVLDGTMDLPHTHRASRAIAIMVLVVAFAALNLLPISVAALGGVGMMLATRCLNWKDALASLSAPVVLIIVTSLALGLAMLRTGAAQYLAELFLAASSSLPVPAMLSLLMLVMALLTNVVSNNAAAVIGTPIAISIAQQLGAPTEPFMLAVLFGANMSYATPIGYQTNLLILSAGGYRFSDFLRVGLPLTGIMWLGFSILLPLLYGI